LIRDGDLGVLRSGYHLVAAPPGYQVYYLAVLAGAARNLAASTDPSYDHLKASSPKPDPRVPFIHNN
jgi:5-deoxy-glucuronate isomerase